MVIVSAADAWIFPRRSSLSRNSSRPVVSFSKAIYNQAFVLMEYFGYLNRDPDQGGYEFWLDLLNNREQGNYRGMVCAFVISAEYQRRFGPLVTRSNADCSGMR